MILPLGKKVSLAVDKLSVAADNFFIAGYKFSVARKKISMASEKTLVASERISVPGDGMLATVWGIQTGGTTNRRGATGLRGGKKKGLLAK